MLSVNADAKTVKGKKKGYLTGILYLSPERSGGLGNVCPNATPGCIASCLNTAGRGAFSNVQRARLEKTRLFFQDRAGMLSEIERDIDALERKAAREDLAPCVRLNGTSDIPWERIAPSLFSRHPALQFYDYTKSERRALEHAAGKLPPNYHLTFSLAETAVSRQGAGRVLASGGNVAAVFRTADYPEEFLGVPVVSGDETDLRFLDPVGVVVALKAKGKARKDTSGFVIDSRGPA